MAFTIHELDTNYSSIPTGHFDIDADEFIIEHGLEIVSRAKNKARVQAEWGNGEGYDSFEIEIVFDSEPGAVNIYMPRNYKAMAEYIAKQRGLKDNRGNSSISALFRYLIDQEIVTKSTF